MHIQLALASCCFTPYDNSVAWCAVCVYELYDSVGNLETNDSSQLCQETESTYAEVVIYFLFVWMKQ